MKSLDRISNLPPHIIDTILSLLPIKDAIGTSILSSKWRYNWTKIPVLRFDLYKFEGSATGKDQLSILEQRFDFPRLAELMINKCKFLNAIKETLLLHEGPLLKFSLSASVDEICVELDIIIRHLSRRNCVKVFKLYLFAGNKYRLPSSIFSLHHLTKLCLRTCSIYCLPPLFKGFRSLTTLHLQDVKISTKDLLHLLSTCPLIKSFLLYQFEDDILVNDEPPIIELIAHLPLIECMIIDDCIFHCFSVNSLPRELQISLVHLKDLHLECMPFLHSGGLPTFFLLIRCSPNLEKLFVQVDDEGIEDDPEVVGNFKKDPITLESYSNISLKNLNDVRIDGIFAFKLLLEFVQLILAKSPMLKKLTILFSLHVTHDEESNISRILLNSPRASATAEIIFMSSI